jgi:hypothetical protein
MVTKLRTTTTIRATESSETIPSGEPPGAGLNPAIIDGKRVPRARPAQATLRVCFRVEAHAYCDGSTMPTTPFQHCPSAASYHSLLTMREGPSHLHPCFGLFCLATARPHKRGAMLPSGRQWVSAYSTGYVRIRGERMLQHMQMHCGGMYSWVPACWNGSCDSQGSISSNVSPVALHSQAVVSLCPARNRRFHMK